MRKLQPDNYDGVRVYYSKFRHGAHVCCTNCGSDFIYTTAGFHGTQGKTVITCPVCLFEESNFFDIHELCSIPVFNQWRRKYSKNALSDDGNCPVCKFTEEVIPLSGNRKMYLWQYYKPYKGNDLKNVDTDEKTQNELSVADMYVLCTKQQGEFVTCLKCLHHCRVDSLHVNLNCMVMCPKCEGTLLDLYHIDVGTSKLVRLELRNKPIPEFKRKYGTYPWDRLLDNNTAKVLVKNYGGWDNFCKTYAHICNQIKRCLPIEMQDEKNFF